ATMMNLAECNLAGGGSFSWLLYFTPSMGQLFTGGAKPTSDPTAGYCFVNESLNSFFVAPVTVPTSIDNGAFTAEIPGKLVMPVYLDSSASSYILLPLSEVSIAGALSDDRNCIGKYNDDKLSPQSNCMPDGFTTAFTN